MTRVVAVRAPAVGVVELGDDRRSRRRPRSGRGRSRSDTSGSRRSRPGSSSSLATSAAISSSPTESWNRYVTAWQSTALSSADARRGSGSAARRRRAGRQRRLRSSSAPAVAISAPSRAASLRASSSGGTQSALRRMRRPIRRSAGTRASGSGGSGSPWPGRSSNSPRSIAARIRESARRAKASTTRASLARPRRGGSNCATSVAMPGAVAGGRRSRVRDRRCSSSIGGRTLDRRRPSAARTTGSSRRSNRGGLPPRARRPRLPCSARSKGGRRHRTLDRVRPIHRGQLTAGEHDARRASTRPDMLESELAVATECLLDALEQALRRS